MEERNVPDKIILSEKVEPETVEVSLDDLEREALIGPDPERPPQGTIADRIHKERMQVREATVRAHLHSKALEGDLSPYLAEQAAQALTQAQQHLREITTQAYQHAMQQARQLGAVKREAITNDSKLTDDGKELRQARREAALDRLDRLDDLQRQQAIETDDTLAEAVALAPRWRLDQLGILPGTVTEAGNRLFQRRAPKAHEQWQRATAQLHSFQQEVQQAIGLFGAGTAEELEAEIEATN